MVEQATFAGNDPPESSTIFLLNAKYKPRFVVLCDICISVEVLPEPANALIFMFLPVRNISMACCCSGVGGKFPGASVDPTIGFVGVRC